MTVSAIITNHNYARFVGAAIESALEQTMCVPEIVVVDDGSTDDSRNVIGTLAARNSPVIPLFLKNGGQAAAINAGFERCTGDIICLLDADDLWYPDKVRFVVDAFGANPQAALVMHAYDMIAANGDMMRAAGSGTFRGGDFASLMIRTGGAWAFGATSSLSLRRSALETILPIPPEQWRLCADGALVYPASFLGEVVSIARVLGGYRIHGANNYFAAEVDPDQMQADIEMTNGYLNDFLVRIARAERVELSRNLQYRRDRYYRRGGSLAEAAAIARLIMTWPLYDVPFERSKFLLRFAARAILQAARRDDSRTRNTPASFGGREAAISSERVDVA